MRLKNRLMTYILIACLGIISRYSISGEMLPFVMPWDDSRPGITDMSFLNHCPAGTLGNIYIKNGHLFAGRDRIRFFGVNLTAGACFPDHETADKVAARMAKFGINAVRFHFLDSTWGEVCMIDYASGSSWNLNADAVDRLDYFISRLREKGIYINLNLLVGRRFGVGDGIDPSINQLSWKAAHAVGFFYAPHLENQKKYARQLLTHRNPYTKLTYAEDPAVAFVEINNENGLIHTWMSGEFEALPEPFATDLRNQWNTWLKKCYGSTPKLADAWKLRNEPLGDEILKNTDYSKGAEGWNVEQHQGAKVESSLDNGILTMKVLQTGTESWHIQFNQPQLTIKGMGVYTVSFRAAADKSRKVGLYLMQAHDPWKRLGFSAQIELDTEWRQFTFTIVASESDENARFGFGDLNQPGATFRFSGLSFKPGGRTGITAEETLENMNIRVPCQADMCPLTFEGRLDWIRFLWETERHHWQSMQSYLKGELNVKALVTGTIVATSTPNLMADMDIVDTHAYWQHPHFPGKPWDRNNWTVQNQSMVDHPEQATVTRLALQRVEGKPHMVSEYNHPAPNTHSSEGPLFLSIYAGLQDWDALFMYTYSHSEERTKADKIPDFFDIGQHPAIMVNMPVASLMFRRSDILPAREQVVLSLPAAEEQERIARDGRAWGVLVLDEGIISPLTALIHRTAISLGPRKSGVKDSIPTLEKCGPFMSDTGQVEWSMPSPDAGLITVKTPRTKCLMGRAEGSNVDMGDGILVAVQGTRQKWCTLSLSLLKGKSFSDPRSILVVATGDTENTGMGWKNAEKNTVGTDWGKSPSLIESVSALITIPIKKGNIPVMYPLDESGCRGKAIQPVKSSNKTSEFRIGSPSKTPWYEISFSE